MKDSEDYTVTLTFKVFSRFDPETEQFNDASTYTQTIANPCTNSDIVSIDIGALTNTEDFTYKVTDTAKSWFAADQSEEITKSGDTYNLCGDLKYSGFVNNAEVINDSTPVNFNAANAQFSVLTTDWDTYENVA